MKLTKTDYRNKLKATTMCDLLTIQMHSAEIGKYDPTPAINDWIVSGPRKRKIQFIKNSVHSNVNALLAGEPVENLQPAVPFIGQSAVAATTATESSADVDSDGELSGYGSDYSETCLSDLELSD